MSKKKYYRFIVNDKNEHPKPEFLYTIENIVIKAKNKKKAVKKFNKYCKKCSKQYDILEIFHITQIYLDDNLFYLG